MHPTTRYGFLRPTRKDGTSERDDGEKRLVERFSLTLTESGVPRMAARLFVALLVAEDGRMTAAETADYLKISRAAVSVAVRLLIQANLVVREREPGHALDHYRVLDDVWIESALWKDGVFPPDGDGSGDRHRGAGQGLGSVETRQFFAFAREELARMMDRWRSRRAELRLRAPHARGTGRRSKRARDLCGDSFCPPRADRSIGTVGDPAFTDESNTAAALVVTSFVAGSGVNAGCGDACTDHPDEAGLPSSDGGDDAEASADPDSSTD